MPLSMSQASLPVFRQGLNALSGILRKAQTHAEGRRIDPAVLLQSRLFPDMFPLVKQVQVAADFAKGTVARLAGEDPPVFPDEETSFEALENRLERTLAYLDSVGAERIDGSEARTITLKIAGQPMSFEGQPYLLHFALPNFFFHLTTAYDILRHNGVELGKRDFIGMSDRAGLKPPPGRAFSRCGPVNIPSDRPRSTGMHTAAREGRGAS